MSAISSSWSATSKGGANEAVLRQLMAIRDSGMGVREFVDRAKRNGERISGLGHRVYKSYDPRAAIAKHYLERIMEQTATLKLMPGDEELFDVALQLEEIALTDDYFVSRHRSVSLMSVVSGLKAASALMADARTLIGCASRGNEPMKVRKEQHHTAGHTPITQEAAWA